MSHGTCETVTIETERTADNPEGIVVINASDFDPNTMELASKPSEESIKVILGNHPQEPEIPVVGGGTPAPAPTGEITGEPVATSQTNVLPTGDVAKVVAPWAQPK